MTGQALLQSLISLLQGGVGFIGGAMIVIGMVVIGVNINEGLNGRGGAIAAGVATLIGGAIIVAAAVYFGQLDISWMS